MAEAVLTYLFTHWPLLTGIGVLCSIAFAGAWKLRGIKEYNIGTNDSLHKHVTECSETNAQVEKRLVALEKLNEAQNVKLDILMEHFNCKT